MTAKQGYHTKQIDYAINHVKEAVTKLREMSPLWEMFKEGVDLIFGTWRGLGVPLKTSPEIVKYLRDATRKIGEDQAFKDSLQRANLQPAYMEGEAFLTFMNSQSEYFKNLLATVDLKK